MLDIEVVKLYRLEGKGTLKAFCDIIISDAILIKGIRIVEGKKGLFVSMPSKQAKDGKWYDSVRPTNNEIRSTLNDVIIKAFND